MNSNPTLVLTVASLKMWFRDRQALFWNLFLPLLLMGIFGLFNFGSFGQISLGVVDLADNRESQGVVAVIEAVGAFDITRGESETTERREVAAGKRDLVLVIPAGFSLEGEPPPLKVLYNQGRPREANAGQAILTQVLDELTFRLTSASRLFVFESEAVEGRRLRYIDFLTPGIIALAIMQMGLFGVAFSFVQLKRMGVLRRMFATPVRPASFLFSYVVTHLVVSLLQTVVLVGVATLVFDVQVVGNVISLLAVALLGGAVFITLGFAVSGWAKNEEVAAPLANVVSLPMMFLSGIFFPREVMPEFLQAVTDYLPLTYMADAMRSISVDGAVLWSQWLNLTGLAVWLIASFLTAMFLFRWE